MCSKAFSNNAAYKWIQNRRFENFPKSLSPIVTIMIYRRRQSLPSKETHFKCSLFSLSVGQYSPSTVLCNRSGNVIYQLEKRLSGQVVRGAQPKTTCYNKSLAPSLHVVPVQTPCWQAENSRLHYRLYIAMCYCRRLRNIYNVREVCQKQSQKPRVHCQNWRFVVWCIFIQPCIRATGLAVYMIIQYSKICGTPNAKMSYGEIHRSFKMRS